MSDDDKRVFIVGSAVLLTIAVAVVVGSMLFEPSPRSHADGVQSGASAVVPSKRDVAAEAGPFERIAIRPPEKTDPPARSLETYYSRRAYPGAPPAIPHAVDTGQTFESARMCRSCHLRGGFVPKFNAFAPMTPHPDFQNCVQCHVPARTDQPFGESDWASIRPPKRKQAAMKGAPLAIPHPIQMREVCVACHAGPASIAPIRSTHPERGNCRQCHVPVQTHEVFTR